MNRTLLSFGLLLAGAALLTAGDPAYNFDDPSRHPALSLQDKSAGPSAIGMTPAGPARQPGPGPWDGDNGRIASANKWFSYGVPPVHKAITRGAFLALKRSDYPELFAYKDEIINGSNDETSHCDPDYLTNGGDAKALWLGLRACDKGGVLPNYKAGKKKAAYYNLGRLLHFTQDMAVPAHAANIMHFIPPKYFFVDGVEKLTIYDGAVRVEPVKELEPYEYYQALQDDTRLHLKDWRYRNRYDKHDPKNGCQLWLPAANAPPIGQDAASLPLGSGRDGRYGCGGDSYVLDVPNDGPLNTGVATHQEAVDPKIGARQISQAASYTAAALKAAAKRLSESK